MSLDVTTLALAKSYADQHSEAGAQVNKIESIKVGGTALEITEKSVNISQISTDLLINGTDTLILNCGSATE